MAKNGDLIANNNGNNLPNILACVAQARGEWTHHAPLSPSCVCGGARMRALLCVLCLTVISNGLRIRPVVWVRVTIGIGYIIPLILSGNLYASFRKDCHNFGKLCNIHAQHTTTIACSRPHCTLDKLDKPDHGLAMTKPDSWRAGQAQLEQSRVDWLTQRLIQ